MFVDETYVCRAANAVVPLTTKANSCALSLQHHDLFGMWRMDTRKLREEVCYAADPRRLGGRPLRRFSAHFHRHNDFPHLSSKLRMTQNGAKNMPPVDRLDHK